MSDNESSVDGPPHSRAGTSKTRETRKTPSVDSSSDELDDAGFSDDGLHERERPKLSWTPMTTTLSWVDADVFLRDLACKQ